MAKQTITGELRERYPEWNWYFKRKPDGGRAYDGWHPNQVHYYGHNGATFYWYADGREPMVWLRTAGAQSGIRMPARCWTGEPADLK